MAVSLVFEYEAAWNLGTSPRTVSVTSSPGDVLVVVGGIENNGGTLAAPTGGTGLTWTAASFTAGTGNQCGLYIWTATDSRAAGSGDQTFTMSVARTGGAGLWYGFNCLRFSGASGVGIASIVNNGTASGTPSMTYTTTVDNALIVMSNNDWNAVDGTTRPRLTISGQPAPVEQTYFRDAAHYTMYASYYPDAGVAGAKTIGFSGPSGQRYVLGAIEVKPAVGGGTTPVSAARSTTWSVAAAVAASRATSWATQAAVAVTRSTLWKTLRVVFGAAPASRETTWNTLARVPVARASSWSVNAVVSATRSTLWSVAGTLATVSTSRATSWATGARVATARATSWNTASRVAASRTTTWDELRAVTAFRNTSWNVDGSLVTVTSSRSTLWSVAALVGSARSTSWQTQAQVSTARPAAWSVLTSVPGAARTAAWAVLAGVTADRPTTWLVLEAVEVDRSTTWRVESDAPIVDLTVLGFNEFQRVVTYNEFQRSVTYSEFQRVITTTGGPMKLSPEGREFYDPRPDTVPAVAAAAWMASFDRGQTWHLATVHEGFPKWMVRGPLATSHDSIPTYEITESVRPWLEPLTADEVVIRKDPPPIEFEA